MVWVKLEGAPLVVALSVSSPTNIHQMVMGEV